MTVVLLWTDKTEGLLWCVSDGRFSRGQFPMTDFAAKILEVPIKLLKQDNENVFGRPIATTTLGFAYCGSSLIALQIYTAVLPLWARIMAYHSDRLPSILDCSIHLADVALAYADDLQKNGFNGDGCECILFGWCPTCNDYKGYAISVEARDAASAVIRDLDLISGRVQVFGTAKAEISTRIQDALTSDSTHASPGRKPKQFIRELLRGDAPRGIGGALQIGIATPQGFGLYQDVAPLVEGRAPARMTFRGFRVGEVGANPIGLPGMV